MSEATGSLKNFKDWIVLGKDGEEPEGKRSRSSSIGSNSGEKHVTFDVPHSPTASREKVVDVKSLDEGSKSLLSRIAFIAGFCLAAFCIGTLSAWVFTSMPSLAGGALLGTFTAVGIGSLITAGKISKEFEHKELAAFVTAAIAVNALALGVLPYLGISVSLISANLFVACNVLVIIGTAILAEEIGNEIFH